MLGLLVGEVLGLEVDGAADGTEVMGDPVGWLDGD